MEALPLLQNLVEPWMLLLADDPLLRAFQVGLMLVGSLVVFTVFYVTRDVLLRTRSFPAMLGSIVLVAFLPIVGFFLYILVRPARTLSQRETDLKVSELHAHFRKAPKPKPGDGSKDKAAR